MVVETNLHMGKGIVRGDAFPIERIITGITSGLTVTAAILTVKDAISDLDASAIFQKSITSVNVAGTGQIEATGSNGTARIRFDITSTNTLAMAVDTDYYFDIQITLSNAEIRTIERGTFQVTAQVTIS